MYVSVCVCVGMSMCVCVSMFAKKINERHHFLVYNQNTAHAQLNYDVDTLRPIRELQTHTEQHVCAHTSQTQVN